jgi:hypothetical protein
VHGTVLTNTCKYLCDTKGSDLLGCNTVTIGVQWDCSAGPQDQMVKEELDCLELDCWHCVVLKVEGTSHFSKCCVPLFTH